MSTLNFPTSPSLNDTYTFGTKTWIWNGAAWQLSTSAAINNIVIGNITPSTGAFTTLTANSTISAVGNITGSYFVGNGSQLTGLPEGYANANVEAYLPTYTGNLTSLTGNVTTTANISGSYILGNGSQLTGLPEGYGNTEVAAYLPTYTGNLVSLTGNVTTTANVSGSYILGNGSQLTGLPESGITWTTLANAAPSSPEPGDFWYDSYTGVKYQYINDGTSNVWVDQSYPSSFSTLAVVGNATIGGNLGVVGNITGSYFVGNGSQLTGLPTKLEVYTRTGSIIIPAINGLLTVVGRTGNIVVNLTS